MSGQQPGKKGRRCQQQKSPAEIWRLVKEAVANIDRRGQLNDDEKGRLSAVENFLEGLSQEEKERLLAAKNYVPNTSPPLNRPDKYWSFILQLRKECTLAELYIAVIPKNWLFYVYIANIPKLVGYLGDKQGQLKFKSNVLTDLKKGKYSLPINHFSSP